MTESKFDGQSRHYNLLELIGEYATKLRQTCDAYYERKRRLNLMIMVGIAIIPPFVYYTFAIVHQIFGSADDFSASRASAMLGGVLGVAFFLVATALIARRDMFRSGSDIRPLAAALEKLVSRASQLEDHSISDADESVLFSLRIAEAESALEYADWVFRPSSFLFGLWPHNSPQMTTRHYRSRSVSL